ncbi:MAG: hypothetical protein ACPL7K_00665 [Armatimonadota bacterium]
MNAQRLLAEYISSSSEDSTRQWEALSSAVRELVHRSVSKHEISDLEDFEEECVVAIWSKISLLRADPPAGGQGIENLEAFVRQTVHNRYCDAIRRKRPKWYNLKLELMEIFSGKTGVEGFAMWQNGDTGAKLCGFAQWKNRRPASARCRTLAENLANFRAQYLDNRDPCELPAHELAAAVLDYCGGPVEIDTLTSCIADMEGARTEEPLSVDAVPDPDGESGAPIDWLISPDTNVEQQVVDASWFSHVVAWFWKEFGELSLKQRKAILYGMSAEQVMALGSVVGLGEVAKCLETDRHQLASLIARLPLPDAVTAQELGIPTRAVPSVRFKAWGRIRRRTRKSALAGEE